MINFLKDVNFESKRLTARRLTPEDARTLFQMYSDSDAMKYRGSKSMTNIDDALKMISESDSISRLRLGIVRKSNNELVGTLLLKKYNVQGRYEIGFSFGKEYWGKGYGQETLQMVEDEVRVSNSVKELCAWCIKDNVASIRIFQKAGFHSIPQFEYPKSGFFVKELK